MTDKIENNDGSTEFGEFENALRRFQPLQADNAEQVFYEAGWQACLANDGKIVDRQPEKRWKGFARGLAVGLAASLLVMACMPGTFQFWSDQGNIANTDSVNPNQDDSSDPEQLIVEQNDKQESHNTMRDENSLVGENSEDLILSQAFHRIWIERSESNMAQNSLRDTSNHSETPTLSPRDVARVLEYF